MLIKQLGDKFGEAFFSLFGGKKIEVGVRWKTLVHYGPIFTDFVGKWPIVLYLDGHPLAASDLQKYFFNEFVGIFRRELKHQHDANVDDYTVLRRYKFSDVLGKMFVRNFAQDWVNLQKDVGVSPEQIEKVDYRELLEKPHAREKQEVDPKRLVVELDGKQIPILNPYIERPIIFKGKGKENRHQGRIKLPLRHDQIELNISKDKIPAEIARLKWKAIREIHDQFWIAHWRDPITGKQKYIWLDSRTDYKKNKDRLKFDIAYQAALKINYIRTNYLRLIKNPNESEQNRQIGVCCYFIDTLGVRIGSTNKVVIERHETDSLGLVQLKIRHVKLLDDFKIQFDFLGKDRVQYRNVVKVPQLIYNKMEQFLRHKEDPEEPVFQYINFQLVNQYLEMVLPGLTAKVFRTFRACHEFQKRINVAKFDPDDQVMKHEVNLLYLEVAKVLNHVIYKKDKQHKQQIEELRERLQQKSVDGKGANDKTQRKILQLRLEFMEQQTNIKDYYFQINTIVNSYIDPRILMSYLKQNNRKIENFYTKQQLNKFLWALEYIEKNGEFKYP